jgi:catechol 2,3-dioxygenase-like lactoylglutathione lyase family enzyme
MLTDAKAYNGFAVHDLEQAREFYAQTLGLQTSEEGDLMWLQLGGGQGTLVYPQPDSTPASYTILNFEVENVDEAVDELAGRGVQFERYEGFEQDEKGVSRGEGPVIAWFKDPSGNVLSLIEAG